MTTVAREVLADCEAALGELAECQTEYSVECSDIVDSKWIRRWVAFMALVRAIGHVLKKIDAERTPGLRKAIDDEYEKLKASKPQPHIFWSFIEDERNLVLKEYRFRYVSGAAGGATSLTVSVGGKESTLVSETTCDLHMRVFSKGPFAGRNQVDVAREAVQWWHNYLDLIDALAGKASGA